MTQETYPRTLTLFSLARSMTALKRSMLSSIVQLMFFLVKASLAAPKTAISLTLAASAPYMPFVLGTRTG